MIFLERLRYETGERLMMTILTILFFGGALGVALFLNSYLDKRQEKRSQR